MERDSVLLLQISESHSELFEEDESENGVRSETNPRRNQTLKGIFYYEGVHSHCDTIIMVELSIDLFL